MTTLPTPARATRITAASAAGVAALAAFALGRVIWPDPPGAMTPSADLLPYFLILSVVESLLFGAGVAYAIVGLPAARRTARSSGQAWALYVSVCFMLLSWWPHDNLHRVLDHHDFAGLARIEYLFHVPLMAGAACVALYTLQARREAR
ncbi:hypothetical protein GCM10023194_78670 [Planotetraspora phitsanulokensis]|uniref:Uncharacterized protein n=1 Tax=Planotetraspora phitsanulokensis TaxID=575192 RepID=A0A8J3U9L3_9ACTN|nr:hypothetical protein [Planotetraspora phitsanulokensis]GII41153.1 hypothetical protein Pph01_61560 [Planotetraspora phitsanulokensis]